MAFLSTAPCPQGKKMEGECKGCREKGVLKNVCAAQCPAYKNMLKKIFINM